MGLLKKFSNQNKKHLKKLRERALQIDALKDKYAALTDEELQGKTKEFQELLAQEEDYKKQQEVLNSILNDAFAVCREAAKRVLNQFPYLVQIPHFTITELERILTYSYKIFLIYPQRFT